MKNVWVWIVVFTLFFQIVQLRPIYSDSYITAEWIFETRIDGSVHMRVKVTISRPCSAFSLNFQEDQLVENAEACEAQTGKDIKVTKTKKEGKINYRCEFDGRKDKGFQFLSECDIMGEVIEKSEVYYFDWKWDGTHKSVATVILPKDYQLLYTDILNPVEISSQSGCTSAIFERPNPESENFRFGVTFSKKGIELINEGDSKFCLGYYDEAGLVYQEAIMFYSQFEKLSGGNINGSLVYLQNRVAEVNDILLKKKTDNDGDGCSQFEDCNDNDPGVHPGTEEIYDGKDILVDSLDVNDSD